MCATGGFFVTEGGHFLLRPSYIDTVHNVYLETYIFVVYTWQDNCNLQALG